MQSTVELPRHYDKDSIFMDILADPHAAAVLKPLLDDIRAAFAPPADEADRSSAASEAITEEMNLAMLQYMPLRGMLSFGGDANSAQMLEQILNELSKA